MIKQIIQDGILIWKMKCPACKVWGELDNDQLFGKVSVLCNCGFHETRVWVEEIF